MTACATVVEQVAAALPLPRREALEVAEGLLAANLLATAASEGETVGITDTECDQCEADSWTCSGCGNHRDSWDWPARAAAPVDAGLRERVQALAVKYHGLAVESSKTFIPTIAISPVQVADDLDDALVAGVR